MTKYSFLVAVYNTEEFLNKCLDSLLNQRFSKKDYEIILIDDGSTDRSSSICDEYALLNPNIRVIHQDNKGLMQARKVATVAASGEYLIYIDSDDYVDKNLLSTVDRFMICYNPDFLMYGLNKVKGDSVTSVRPTKTDYSILSQDKMIKCLVKSNKYNSMVCKAIKSEVVKGHIDEIYSHCVSIGEDKLQTAYLMKYSNKMLVIRDCLYYYVIHDNSMIHKKRIDDIYDVINMYAFFSSVINEIIENNTMLLKEKSRILMDLYSNSIQGVMEHIYKYNTMDDYDIKEKVNNIDALLSENKAFFFRTIRKSQLKVYNRFRLWLLIHFNGKALVRFDCMIHHLRF